MSIFERKLADFSGSKFAVLTDCCTNAIFLSLMYLKQIGEINEGQTVGIPDKTYVSVAQTISHAGLIPRLRSLEWQGMYLLEGTRVVDGAGRFTEGMYKSQDSLHCLSFQIKKRLPIGRGGAILTDDEGAAKWLKLASYDGRQLETPYNATHHVTQFGWHMYMTPEDAARGIWIMDQLPKVNSDTMGSKNYPEISKYAFCPEEWK